MARVVRTINKPGVRALEGIVAMGRVTGKVGWLDSAHYPDGGPPIALVAAVNEFGWPEHNIPPRLGMRATAEAMRGAWAQVSQTVAKRVASGTMTPQQAFEVITAKAAGDCRKTIATVTAPPLKVATVEARLRRAGFNQQGKKAAPITANKPLVDTGALEGHLTNSVENKA